MTLQIHLQISEKKPILWCEKRRQFHRNTHESRLVTLPACNLFNHSCGIDDHIRLPPQNMSRAQNPNGGTEAPAQKLPTGKHFMRRGDKASFISLSPTYIRRATIKFPSYRHARLSTCPGSPAREHTSKEPTRVQSLPPLNEVWPVGPGQKQSRVTAKKCCIFDDVALHKEQHRTHRARVATHKANRGMWRGRPALELSHAPRPSCATVRTLLIPLPLRASAARVRRPARAAKRFTAITTG